MSNCKRIFQKISSSNNLHYAIDQYADWAVIQVYVKEPKLEDVLEVFEKNNILGAYLKVRENDGKHKTVHFWGKEAPNEIIVEENNIKFLIDIKNYLDVGLFLDHRISRELIGEMSKDKNILNLFAYTGSFSLYAAKNGAKTTSTVDLSKTYCNWAKRNFELNNIEVTFEDSTKSPNLIWQMDTFEFIDLAIETDTKYDIIVCDPPSFSRNGKEVFNVQKDHAMLIRKLQNNLLNKNGILFFSTNLQSFKLDDYIRPGADKLTKQTVPEEYLPFRPHQSFAFYV